RARIDQPGLVQTIERFLVVRRARRLPAHRNLPLETQPLERGENRLRRTLAYAWHVDVFEPDEPGPAGRKGVGVARHGRDQRAEMQRTGGRGREPAAIRRARGPGRRRLACGRDQRTVALTAVWIAATGASIR